MDSDETRNTPEEQPDEEQPAGEAEPATATADEKPEEPEKKIPYEIVEKAPREGSVVHYKVSIPRESLTAEAEEMLLELKGNVSIEGFRRGKAPRKLIEIRYGKEVKEDAVRSLANNVGEQIIKADDLQLVAEGDMHDFSAEGDGPVEITLEFEVRPEIDPTGYDSMEVEVIEQKVDEEMVERRLEQLRESNAQYKSADEGAKFNPGDGATFDYEVLDASGQRLERQCAENVFERDPMGRLPRELSEKLPGAAPGDTIEAPVKDTHQSRQGQERTSVDTHRLTLREIKIKELPDLDDEFAKDLGEFNTIGDLRDQIRQDMEARAESMMREQALSKVHDILIEANPFDAPRSTVAATTMAMVRERLQQMAYAGINISQLSEDVQKAYVEGTRQEAEKSVRAQLLLEAIAKKENVEVDDADVEQALERIAESEGRRALAIRARLEREGSMDRLKDDLRMQKVNDLLLSRTKMNKVQPPPPDEQKTENDKEA